MRDINDIMPKLPPNYFGVVSNFNPDKMMKKEFLKTFPFNSKWHTVLKENDSLVIDGKNIIKHSAKRYT